MKEDGERNRKKGKGETSLGKKREMVKEGGRKKDKMGRKWIMME